jgi:RNA polymerase sigma-70 factor (ECF subfamily)
VFSNTSSTDQQLTRRMQQGDRKAFADFVDRFGGQIHRLARRYTRSEADAEDLTQEIFVDLCRGIAGFRGEAKLSTWVYRVALNHCLKHQGRRRVESVPIDDIPLAAGDDHDPERSAVRADLAQVVEGALGTLSDIHREVVVLHEMHGLTYQECADLLGVPVGTVKSRLFNAFTRLRDRLGNYVRGEEDVFLPGASASQAPGTLREAVALKETR